MSKKNKHNNPPIKQISASKPATASPTSKPPTPLTSAVSILPAQPKVAPISARSAKPNPSTLEQRRAAHALQSVRELEQAPFAKEYRSYVEGLPATIVMNGLGQACATLLAAANGNGDREHAYQLLHRHLENWLCHPDGGVYRAAPLIDAIVNHGQAEYVHAQAEALAYLVWLKKFAQAFLKSGGRD